MFVPPSFRGSPITLLNDQSKPAELFSSNKGEYMYEIKLMCASIYTLQFLGTPFSKNTWFQNCSCRFCHKSICSKSTVTRNISPWGKFSISNRVTHSFQPETKKYCFTSFAPGWKYIKRFYNIVLVLRQGWKSIAVTRWITELAPG